METDNYFGDISIPQDEEEEDLANDLTFGDIGDIKAGDETSDAAWKPDHQALASQIEAEKDALLRARLSALSATPPAPSSSSSLKHAFNATTSALPADTHASAWSMLQAVHAQHHQQQSPHPRVPSTTHPPAAVSQLHARMPQALPRGVPPQPMPMPRHAAAAAAAAMPRGVPVPMPPTAVPMHAQALLQQLGAGAAPGLKVAGSGVGVAHEYQQRMMLAYQEQQTRGLLRQHHERAQQQLREAERAQQAGISFDRAEFDRHQEATRQMILSDHYARMQRIQFHAWQQSQQLAKQGGVPQGKQPQSVELQGEMNGGGRHAAASPPRPMPSPPQQYASPPQRMSPSQNSIEAQLSHAYRAHITGNGHVSVDSPVKANGHADLIAFAEADDRERRARERAAEEKARQQLRTDVEHAKAPRLLEIERQMAEAGLGPSTSPPGRRTDAFGMPMRQRRVEHQNHREKKHSRRLESMTDRDQELVFRSHLRQIESSVSYKDDYYNSVLRRKEKVGTDEVFSELAERVQHLQMRTKEKVRNGESTRVRGSKRRKDKAGSGEHMPGSSPQHSSQNLKALANALGTVQSWNPRAPRRVMDFGLLEKRDPINPNAPQQLLREDERVQVRMAIERGYDEIAVIHDIARGERQQSLASSMQKLFEILHLADRKEEDVDKDRDRHQSTRFFATMCVIEKGRLFLSRVLELLDGPERVRVMSAIFENLGMVVFASQRASDWDGDDDSGNALFKVLIRFIQEPEVTPRDCIVLFEAFSTSHVPHRDAFLTTFRSAKGSRLMFLCMQRVSAGLAKQDVDETELSLKLIEQFCISFTESLQDIFEGAESVSRVWEVTASLDSLARGHSRNDYRTELNRLLRTGAVPPPPTT